MHPDPVTQFVEAVVEEIEDRVKMTLPAALCALRYDALDALAKRVLELRDAP